MKNQDSIRLATKDKSPLILYPNPTSNKLNIKWENVIPEAILKIYDINGNIVLDKVYFAGGSIDVSGFTPGFYHLQLEAENKLFYSRFIKK